MLHTSPLVGYMTMLCSSFLYSALCVKARLLMLVYWDSSSYHFASGYMLLTAFSYSAWYMSGYLFSPIFIFTCETGLSLLLMLPVENMKSGNLQRPRC